MTVIKMEKKKKMNESSADLEKLVKVYVSLYTDQ